MTMRAIIVDDEELSRRGIRALLNRAGDVEIVSECGNGEEAIRRSALLSRNSCTWTSRCRGKQVSM